MYVCEVLTQPACFLRRRKLLAQTETEEMVFKLSIVAKRVASSSDQTAANQEQTFKTYLTKEVEEGVVKKLSFDTCIDNLLSKESSATYKSAFSPHILVRRKEEDPFTELSSEEAEKFKVKDVVEVGLLATKRRVLKQILKEVKKERGPVQVLNSAVSSSQSGSEDQAKPQN